MHAVALVGVGAIAGGIASATLSAGAATATTTVTTAIPGSTGTGGSSTTSSPPAGSGRQRPAAPPGGAGLPLHGTVTAVSASSVTIKTSSGTTTYAVTATSDIEKNGKTGSSALSTGDVVAFSTVATDGSTAIDKLVAGSPAGMVLRRMWARRRRAKPGTGQGSPPERALRRAAAAPAPPVVRPARRQQVVGLNGPLTAGPVSWSRPPGRGTGPRRAAGADERAQTVRPQKFRNRV